MLMANHLKPIILLDSRVARPSQPPVSEHIRERDGERGTIILHLYSSVARPTQPPLAEHIERERDGELHCISILVSHAQIHHQSLNIEREREKCAALECGTPNSTIRRPREREMPASLFSCCTPKFHSNFLSMEILFNLCFGNGNVDFSCQ